MATTTDITDSLLVSQCGATRVLTFNRPARRNALDAVLRRAFASQLAQADADPEVRSIVITGAGTAFCAGADMGELIDQAAHDSQDEFLREAKSALHVRKPLIAAINGPAVGLGLVQALYCDVRFCTPDARLSTAFTRRGFVGEFGIVSSLVSLAGRGRASDLLISGRTFTGREAYEMGIVNCLVDAPDLVAVATAYAQEINANCSPQAMAVIKSQLRVEPQLEFWKSIRHAEALQLASLGTPDVLEGFNAYFDKRAPVYQPLQ